jgi:hypothetical protein
MKKGLMILVSLALLVNGMQVFASGGADSAASGAKEPVKLVMGSWRADDVEQMKGLLAEYT